MCMAIPSKVIGIEGTKATVECFDLRRDVSLLLIDEEIVVGDYLLVRAGGYAYERVEAARALEALALIAELTAQDEATRAI
jgi:hydrogenase expression/formation protein HypC